MNSGVDSPERQTILEDYIAPLAADNSQETFLVKVPEWLGQQILSSARGSVLGESVLLQPGTSCDLHLNPDLSAGKPSQFNLKVSQAVNPANTFMVTSETQSASISQIRQAMHALPTRSDAYKRISQSRAHAASSATTERRTVLDDGQQSKLSALGTVQMFKLASNPQTESLSNIKKNSKPVLPHSLRAQTSAPGDALSAEDLVMKLLVDDDVGWNVQNFMKNFKDAGGSGLNLVQLKAKLAEICEYTRRGEDSHPKYYLKLEYKTT